MKKIAVLGAGRSAPALINYLLTQATTHDWEVTVGDQSIEQAQSRVGKHERGHAIAFNAEDEMLRKQVVSGQDVIISLLPPNLHDLVAMHCIALKKPLLTASYVSKAIEDMAEEAKKSGVLLMYEMGLDPGIDHMSAMKAIHDIRKKGGEITSFKSYCGGLIAPESDDNPWNYKFTWNPRNVVLAGQGGAAQYIEEGKDKFIPYQQLFTRTERINIKGHGKFEAYANRDSLSYIKKYGLQGIPTILRATLRQEGYCKSWDAFVQLGMTDDTYNVIHSEGLTYANWLESYLPKDGNGPLKKRLADYLSLKKDGEVIKKLAWLGLFGNQKIKLKKATPAQILQDLLEEKWKIKKTDKDLVVMRHLFEYKKGKRKYQHTSTLVLKGHDSTNTAMAKTVGLPLGIMAKLLLTSSVNLTGVNIPVMPEIYLPVLNELKEYGILFVEEEEAYK